MWTHVLTLQEGREGRREKPNTFLASKSSRYTAYILHTEYIVSLHRERRRAIRKQARATRERRGCLLTAVARSSTRALISYRRAFPAKDSPPFTCPFASMRCHLVLWLIILFSVVAIVRAC